MNSEQTRPDAGPAGAGAGYEPSDARAQPLVVFAVVLLAVIGASFVVGKWVFGALGAEHGTSHPMTAYREPPRAPLLQAIPSAELEEHRRTEVRRLSTYGWIDETNGIVRIPIERAMELAVEAGLGPDETEPAIPRTGAEEDGQ